MSLKPIEELKRRNRKIAHIKAVLNLLDWDSAVNMPDKGSDKRAETVSQLSSIAHNLLMEIDADGLLSNLKEELDEDKLSEADGVIVKEIWRTYNRQNKLPEEFVRELSELQAKTQRIWEKARELADFEMFAPHLRKIVELKRKEADLVGYKYSPYDVHLDVYEPGMTTKESEKILGDLREFTVLFLEKIQDSKVEIDREKIKGDFPISKQEDLNKHVAKIMGFDFEAGRIDISTHPFTTEFHPQDVRFTTRYKRDDLLESVTSTIHEVGHALYEQGLPSEHFGTPLAEYISLGIHESQSRVWENQIGRSKEFWEYLYPELQEESPDPFKEVPLDEFYKCINKVEPSLIRTEADEVTYNIHIIIRFEIEKELIEGSIGVRDLPKIWNDKYKEYLGVDVPDDARGVMQDVHWSAGLFGYFPTYSFGNLYAAQFYNQAKKEIPDLENKIENGQLKEIKDWLGEKIHIHGKQFTAGELVKEVTGEDLNADYFSEYLEEKYTDIYKLK